MVNILSDILKDFAVGKRTPNDSFFLESNAQLPYLKRLGVVDVDDEELLHPHVPTFKCNFSACSKEFDTIFQFEQHYNSCHRYTCCECGKILQTSHLLDLHLTETHDSFFAVQALRKPMFRCFIEECPDIFLLKQLRKEHIIKDHKFPAGFPFENTKEKQKKNSKTSTKDVKMDVDLTATKNKRSSNRGQRRQKILSSFSADLMKSLPK